MYAIPAHFAASLRCNLIAYPLAAPSHGSILLMIAQISRSKAISVRKEENVVQNAIPAHSAASQNCRPTVNTPIDPTHPPSSLPMAQRSSRSICPLPVPRDSSSGMYEKVSVEP